MDKIAAYKKIIRNTLEDRTKNPIANAPGAKGHLVIDEKAEEFILLWSGWSGTEYTHSLMFHIGIRDGKVWVFEDRTDIGIASLFVESGIPKSEIVLAYVAPYARSLSGFAAA